MARLRDEIAHIAASDPAAPSKLEVALTYPGFHAVLAHRLAHWLWQRRLKLVSRITAALSRLLTGIEIHPAAEIGEYCFIDHGMGVVVGETAVIGNRVTLFHGTTLGGQGKPHHKRHATVGDDVMVGAGAKLLGPIVVGAGARIGANAVVTRDVAPGATVVGIPARAVDALSDDAKAAGGDAADEIARLRDQLASMEARLMQLEAAAGRTEPDVAAGGWVPSRTTKRFDA